MNVFGGNDSQHCGCACSRPSYRLILCSMNAAYIKQPLVNGSFTRAYCGLAAIRHPLKTLLLTRELCAVTIPGSELALLVSGLDPWPSSQSPSTPGLVREAEPRPQCQPQCVSSAGASWTLCPLGRQRGVRG